MPVPSTPAVSATRRLTERGEWLLVLGLAATLAWTTLCLGGYLAETMAVTSWAVFGLSILGGALWLAGTGRRSPALHLAALLPLPFLAYSLASVLWLAPARWLAWREWLLWLQMWLVFALVLHFGRSRRQTGVLAGTLVLLGVIGSGLAAYQRYADPKWLMLGWVHGWSQAAEFAGRSAGMFGVPNSFAAMLELLIPAGLALGFARAVQPGRRLLGGTLSALFLFALVLTVSRGAWISLALALAFWPLSAGHAWRRKLAGSVLILLMLTAGFWGLYHFNRTARERMQPFLEGRFESSRPVIWRAAWRIWRDHPWFGSGAASYNVEFDRYRPAGFVNEPEWAHNDYLNTLSDYGVAGFVLWAGAGLALLGLGWRAARRPRPEVSPGVEAWPWRLGLWLGLLAFALHLAVDFHTKVPALAFAAALSLGLLLRDEPELSRPVPGAGVRGLAAVLLALTLWVAVREASPLYRAEALRYVARRAIDRQALTGEGDLRKIIPQAEAAFSAAVAIDPRNGQAWSDLSYATAQSAALSGGNLIVFGRHAALSASRALALCPELAEFWVRQGVALDMQARPGAAEDSFRQALRLAPKTAPWWYYYAYHLSARPGEKAAARRAVATCLSLDPSISAAVTLQRRLSDSTR